MSTINDVHGEAGLIAALPIARLHSLSETGLIVRSMLRANAGPYQVGGGAATRGRQGVRFKRTSPT
ncbi:MAG: hypothetical protein JWM82_750 [Myxococcales bacterium]|nr:hypothetical protein [Myxococcales bacterium]